MLGVTWATTLDAALDEISRLQIERDNALDSLVSLLEQQPHLEANEHFVMACLALQ